MRLAVAEHDVVGREPAARFQHPADFAVKPRPIGDVHRHMLQQHGVERGGVEWQFERAAGLERYERALPGPFGQIARGIDEGHAEVDARHPAAASRRQKSRRSADAGADIQHRHAGGDPGELRQLGGRCKPTRVKLIECGELLRRQPLVFRSEDGKR